MSAVVLGGLFVLCLAGWVGLEALDEPGPSAPAVLWRRYGWEAFGLAGCFLAALVVLLLRPTLLVLAGGVLGGLLVLVGLWRHWTAATAWRAVRRIVLRARWTSAARSCGLTIERDRRVEGVGADAATLVELVRLEHTPRLWRGRSLPTGAGCVWLCEPARGSTVAAVAEQAEALAAALHVGTVTVHRVRADRAEVEILWRAE